MKKTKQKNKSSRFTNAYNKLPSPIRNNLIGIICFTIPFLLYLISSIVCEIKEIGLFLPYDSIAQYVPFFSEYRYKILHGESVFFSFHTGGGWDFYTLWSYYLTSPLNLLIIFFKNISHGVVFIQTLKIGLCGLSFHWVAKKKFGDNYACIAFSLCYSLSGYIIAYYFNIMWLDIVILFPILLHFFNLFLEKKSKLYPLILGIVVFLNFYMAIQICIFLVFYFLTRKFDSIKDFFNKGIRFSIASICGGLMGSVIIIPYAMNTMPDGNTFPKFYIMDNFLNLFSQHFFLSKADVDMSFGSGANLYCGVLSIILLTYYFINNKNTGEKIRNAILLGVMFISVNISTLTYIFHGFDEPTGYAARFSYMYIYIIVMIAYEEFLNIDFKNKEQNKKFLKACIPILLFAIAFLVYQCMFGDFEYYRQSAVSTIFLILLYMVTSDKKGFVVLLIFEIIISFFGNTKVTTEMGVDEKMAEIYELRQDTVLREVIDVRDTSNECVLYNMNGLSLFSSTLVKPYSSLVFKNGFRGGTNYITSIGHTPVTELLFGMDYVYSKKDAEFYSYDKVEESENYAVFKNRYPLSIGYVVPRTIQNWNWNVNNPYQAINNFVCAYYDEFTYNNEVYQRINEDNIVIDTDMEAKEYEINHFNNFGIKLLDNNEKKVISFSHMTNENNLSVNVKGIVDRCKIYINEEEVYSNSSASGEIIPLMNLKKGDMVRVEITSDKKDGSVYVNMAYFKEDVFERFATDFTSKPVEITQMSDNKITGNIPEVEDGEIVIFSIPYLSGWTYEDVIPRIIHHDTDLCEINTQEGPFTMTYVITGFKQGCIMTIIFSILCISYPIIKRKSKSKEDAS